MNTRLAEIVGDVPNEVFYNDNGHPNYNGIFAEVARRIYNANDDSFAIPVHDFLTDKLPNLSSFQRAVAKERQRREG